MRRLCYNDKNHTEFRKRMPACPQAIKGVLITMLKSHEKFHSANGRRLILIVDDEPINRAMLRMILEEEYDIIEAADGEEAMRLVGERAATLSLMLLDLLMPGINGLEVLRRMKGDLALQSIPVIVMTADQSAEVESLRLGAIDFIPKPYPQPEVIHARILRTIELSEDRDIILSTERDQLTGLYNREFFYRYAEQFDQHHKELEMDAVVVDINHFHTINERYGRSYGDEVLRRIGGRLVDRVHESGGIVCRRESDIFLVYCPHREDYREILESVSAGLAGDEAGDNRVRLRMGVYSCCDKSIDVERRFDRAKIAADSVRSSYANAIAEYDSTLHESELYAEQLLEDFHEAIRTRQFKVYYQPKFDIRPEIPVLSSAEALVRWQHPRLGLISPGIFIPLFEENGLIRELDHYVWREAAAQVKRWRDRFGISVPVSVNVSRIDMYDPALIDTFRALLEENGLTAREILLEITESAYTQNSAQIIETVDQLRALGFQIEMDDFGSGYSSLNMLSILPIDALKLDMQFIRTAFAERRNTRMLEVIIDIADYLSVPVIAEGVETEEQLRALRAMGCDIVQGYYFSRPVPPEEYECFIKERASLGDTDPAAALMNREHRQTPETRSEAFGTIAHALTNGFERIYYIDAGSGHYVEFSANGRDDDLQIERSGADFFADLQQRLQHVIYPEDLTRVSLSMQKEALLSQLVVGSHFSMTYRLMIDGKPVFYNLKAVCTDAHDGCHIVIGVSNVDAAMQQALDGEKAAAKQLEFFTIAKALAADYFSIYYVDTETDRFIEYSPDEKNRSLEIERSGEDFFRTSCENMERVAYPADRETICAALEKKTLLQELEKNGTFTLRCRMMFDGSPAYVSMKVTRMTDDDGRYIVIGLNNIDAQVRREQEFDRAREQVNRDALTGVKSKHAYVETEARIGEQIRTGAAEPFAVAVCDLNGLKTINDTLGHKEGDRYICEASRLICNIFQHSPVFRIGGDEFVALLQGRDYEHRRELIQSLIDANRENAKNGGVIVASGISDYIPGQDTAVAAVFERADAAMYRNKTALKNG